MTTQIETNDNNEGYKGYSLFSEIENRTLRAFNQWNVLSNMTQNGLDAVGAEYIDKLPAEDKYRLMMMVQYIKLKGLEETKREIILSNKAAA